MKEGTRNRLGGTTSPYLLQHKDNPVHWYAWGEDALRAASLQDKPILLSIGYAACHWCHVMAHECFENQAIADLMNRHFINIKVDREERPDLDAIYQQALSLLGQQGGWPLTMFLLPDGKPFWGGTYFPPESRWGRPGFPEVLEKIAEIYRLEPQKVASNSQELMTAMHKLAHPKSGSSLSRDMLDQMAHRLLEEMDWKNGGIGRAPKFPQFPVLEFLWRAYLRSGVERYKEAVVISLRHICQGGIYDHLGGGISRYSVDERWLVPHFEKMLYDNASLLGMLAMIQPHVQDPLFTSRAREIAAFLDRDMSSEAREEQRGYAASWDADSEGHEGKYYIWRKSEIEQALGEESKTFCIYYDVTATGNWEGTNILNRLSHPHWLGDEQEHSLESMRKILERERQRRIKPGFDDKVLTDWNGMAIKALCLAGLNFAQDQWIERASEAYNFLKKQMFDKDVLHHSWCRGKIGPLASLDDHVQLSDAALALYEVTGEISYLEDSKARLADMDHDFWDKDKGGYFNTSLSATDIVIRQKNIYDGATPNGNGLALELLTRLWLLTGQDSYKERALLLEKTFAGEAERNFFPMASYLNAVDFLYTPLLIVLCADAENRQFFLDAIKRAYHPNMILQLLSPGEDLAASHPAHGKTHIKNAAFLCLGQNCSLPFTDPESMEQALKESYK